MQPEIAIELRALAITVGFAIVLAVFITRLPKKSKKLKVGGVYWTAEKYFEHLKNNIILSDNLENLSALRASIEGFRVKTFRERIFRRDRKRYYKQLKEAYDLKQRNLILHPTTSQLCKS